MCGIAGIVDYEHPTLSMCAPYLQQMQETMKRRGPDQKGVWESDYAALVHARLSIVDLEKGIQPMKRENCCIVYNGELYNTKEIRDALIKEGYVFSTHSDTEVILNAYLAWKEHCVERFNGIFAFAIWDTYRKELFVARDPMGVKPFFYTFCNDAFLFGSEIKTLLAHPFVKPRISQDSILQLMLLGPGRIGGNGVFEGIEELKPGSCGFVDVHGLHRWEYHKMKDRQHTDSFETTLEQVRKLVIDAITRQLQADVEVGTFLSGGLDSSIITALASKRFAEEGKKLHTFSLDYEDNAKYFHTTKFQPNADPYYIEQMVKSIQSEHHRIVLKPQDVAEALYAAVDARDLPGMADVDSSLLLFCKEIAKYVKVALSGECADELFGGYPWYRDPKIRMQEGFPWSQTTAYRAGFLKEEWLKDTDPQAYVSKWYVQTCSETDCMAGIDKNERRLREMTMMNMKWFMQTLLDRKDRMSMYSSLEVRVPFCDVRLANYLYSIPWHMKDHNGYEKGLLREAVKGLLPEEILWRKKSPYPKTWHPLYRQCVSEQMRKILQEREAPLFSIVRRERVEALLGEESAVPWYGQLMTTPQTIAYLLQLNYWLKQYQVEIIKK